MFSHVTVGCADLGRAAAFYDAVLSPLGLRRRATQDDGGPKMECWTTPGGRLPEFFVTLPFDGGPSRAGNGVMGACAAASPALVDAAHAAGLTAGGADEGAPGPRPHHGPGYDGAYLRDPDGNKVHVAHRGDVSEGAG